MMTLLFLTRWGKEHIGGVVVLGLTFDLILASQIAKFLKYLLTTIR
jgi:hypothetical protein